MFVSRAYQGVQQDFDQQLLNAPSIFVVRSAGEGWRELNKNGQSDHHNSYTQFGSINKVKSKANQEIKDSEKGITHISVNFA
jgi:hypothetical protein